MARDHPKIERKDWQKDEASEYIGQFARVRISINITQSLKNVVFLQQEGGKYQRQSYVKGYLISISAPHISVISLESV